MALPSSAEPVWPRTNSSVSPAATIAPCQAMSWPNQSFISKRAQALHRLADHRLGVDLHHQFRQRQAGDEQAGADREHIAQPAPDRLVDRLAVRAIDQRGGQLGDVAQASRRRPAVPPRCCRAPRAVCAAASPRPATRPSGCNALRPLRNTRVSQCVARGDGEGGERGDGEWEQVRAEHGRYAEPQLWSIRGHSRWVSTTSRVAGKAAGVETTRIAPR